MAVFAFFFKTPRGMLHLGTMLPPVDDGSPFQHIITQNRILIKKWIGPSMGLTPKIF